MAAMVQNSKFDSPGWSPAVGAVCGSMQGGYLEGQRSEANAIPKPQHTGNRGGSGRQAAALHRRWLPGDFQSSILSKGAKCSAPVSALMADDAALLDTAVLILLCMILRQAPSHGSRLCCTTVISRDTGGSHTRYVTLQAHFWKPIALHHQCQQQRDHKEQSHMILFCLMLNKF